jgi:hypothetical protein
VASGRPQGNDLPEVVTIMAAGGQRGTVGAMPIRHRGAGRLFAAGLALALAPAAACSRSSGPPGDGGPSAPVGSASQPAAPPTTPAPAAPAPPVRVRVQVPAGLGGAPFDVPRYLTVPGGWTVTVYARITRARFLTPTPNGDLLVSQPSTGASYWCARA